MLLQFINWINLYLSPFASASAGTIFVLLLIFGLIAKKSFAKFFKSINRRVWLIIFLIFLLGLILRLFVPSHQLLQAEDEMSYMMTAKGLLDDFFGIRHERAMGWSLILAISFKLFGLGLNTAFYTSSALGALTILNVFFIALILSKKEEIALYSSFLFAVLPLHIFWSGSAETNVPSLFFLTLAIFFGLLHFQNRNNGILFRLSLASLAFACLLRPENYFVFVIFLILALIFNFRSFRSFSQNFILPAVIISVLIAPCFFETAIHYFGYPAVAKVSNWTLKNLVVGSKNYGKYFFNNALHPIIFSILYLAGAAYLFFKNKKIFLFLISWLLLFYLVYFPSWFGGAGVGGGSRIFLNFYLPMAIFGGYFICFLRKYLWLKGSGKALVAILFLLIQASFLVYIKNNNNYIGGLIGPHKAETEIIKLAEKKVPKDCLVIANFPLMLITTNLEIIEINNGEEYGAPFYNSGCTLFFQDYTCGRSWSIHRPDYLANCAKMKEYNLEPYLTYSEKNYTVGFYKILTPSHTE